MKVSDYNSESFIISCRFENYLSEGWTDRDDFILVQFILVASDNIQGFWTKYLELVDCHRHLINDGTFLPGVRS